MKNKIFSSAAAAITVLALLPLSIPGGLDNVLAANPCAASNIRWASSSNRIYVTGNVSCTFSDIKTLGSKSIPLTAVSPDVWLLRANILLQEGATLVLHGTAAGGDVNELRLKSNNSSAPFSFVKITAQAGNIDVAKTKITSWDEAAGAPDTEHASFGRALMQVKSFLDSAGNVKESRMDIKDSEISHLGYFAAESYGLSWKVLGTTAGIFDQVGVFGDIMGNNIHHNYFGVYTFGAQAMNMSNNDVHDNVVYGLDPHDDSDFLVIDDNTVHNNGNHGIICSKRCNNLQITNNNSSNNGSVGIMLHKGVTISVVTGNTTNNNGDSGLAIFDSNNNTLSGNTSKFNRRGLRLSVGSSGNTAENNDFSSNTEYGIYTFKGTDLPTSGDGRIRNNTFSNNTVNSNNIYAMRIGESDNNVFNGNSAEGNTNGIFVAGPTQGNQFLGNVLSGNGTFNIQDKSGTGTIISNNTLDNTERGVYLNQSANAIVESNSMTKNSIAGVDIIGGSGSKIRSNTIDGVNVGQFGIRGSQTSGAQVTLNNICRVTVGIQMNGGNTVSGNTVSNTACGGQQATQTATLSLNLDWNLITLPLQAVDGNGADINYTAETFGKSAKADVVSKWVPATQQYVSHVVGVPINDFPIENGMGFFVHATAASSVPFSGTAIAQVTPAFISGWNMVGWTDAVPTTAQDLGGLITGADLLAKFDSVNQQWISHIPSFPVNNFNVNRGDGVFVHII